MEQVWKCGFCRDTNKEKEKVASHEADCGFNPKNKGCYTCENRETTWWNGVGEDECIKGHSVFGTDDGECDEWVIEVTPQK